VFWLGGLLLQDFIFWRLTTSQFVAAMNSLGLMIDFSEVRMFASQPAPNRRSIGRAAIRINAHTAVKLAGASQIVLVHMSCAELVVQGQVHHRLRLLLVTPLASDSQAVLVHSVCHSCRSS